MPATRMRAPDHRGDLLEVDNRPRVVIVGAGFGCLAAAQRLAGQPIDSASNRIAI
jgi:cation diffusion facilitator CzcD-associated flavoprotein CzcO